MFAVLRRHQKWFWGAIIAVVIPSFVIFFTPDVSFSGRGGADNFGTINGRVITREQYAEAYHEMELFYLLNYGEWPSANETAKFGFDLDRESRNRVLMLELLKENRIEPSTEASAKFIANITSFRDRRTGTFRVDIYEQFIKQTLNERGITERQFERFAAHQVGIQQLISSYGSNGKLVTPLEAEMAYRRENESMELEAVYFSMTNHIASINITTNSLLTYYTNQIARYRIPEKVQVRYVKFIFTNFLSEAQEMMAKNTNLTMYINQIYLEQGPNFYTDTNGLPLPEQQAKEKIKKDQVEKSYLRMAALRKASTFAAELYEMKPSIPDNLNKLASSNKFDVAITAPFAQFETPTGLNVSDNFATAAFKLTEENPFAEPIQGEDAVFVFTLDKKFSSEVPSFESIQPRVMEDYRRSEAIRTAQQEGESFYQKLTNAISAGKTFAAACAESKINPIQLPKFTLSTREVPQWDDRFDLSTVKDVVQNLAKGKFSRFNYSRDGGYIVSLKERHPVDETELKQKLPEYQKRLSQSRTYEAFNEWLTHQTVLAKLAAPPAPAKENQQK